MKKSVYRFTLGGLITPIVLLMIASAHTAVASVFEHEEIFSAQGDLLPPSATENTGIAKKPIIPVKFISKNEPSQVPAPIKIDLSQLTPADNTRVIKIIDDHIKPHLQNDLKNKIGEKLKEVLSKVAIGAPMSPETRNVLTKKAYQALQGALLPYGITIQESTLRATFDKLFLWSSKFGVYPTAFTVGVMARYQTGLGGSFGYQYNFYLDQVYGVQMGFSQQTKIQFYASLCFGECFGGDATGYYAGVDGGAGFGVGGNFFIEGGFDLTDMLFHNDGSLGAKDFYQSKSIYVGLGSDVGVGAGISANIFYYSLDTEKLLERFEELN
jgi:hypothetical protein